MTQDWFQGIIEDDHFNSAYGHIGYNGISFNFPMPYETDDFNVGGQFDYPVFHGLKSEETFKAYTIAVKLSQYMSIDDNSFLNSLDYSLGITWIDVHSNISLGSYKSSRWDIGTMLKYRLSDYYGWKDYKIETSLGLTYKNIGRRSISSGQGDEERLPEYLKYGFGVYGSYPTKAISLTKPIAEWFPTLVSISYSYGNEHWEDENSRIFGHGGEIGLLNTFFYRHGHYSNHDGHVSNETNGFGLKISAKDIVAFEANWSREYWDNINYHQDFFDWMVHFDFVKIYDFVR